MLTKILLPSPRHNGLIIQFDYATWGGSGADGYSVYLFDANALPSISAPSADPWVMPKNCHRRLTPVPGISGGYVGIGVDEFGNSPTPQKDAIWAHGWDSPTRSPSAVPWWASAAATSAQPMTQFLPLDRHLGRQRLARFQKRNRPSQTGAGLPEGDHYHHSPAHIPGRQRLDPVRLQHRPGADDHQSGAACDLHHAAVKIGYAARPAAPPTTTKSVSCWSRPAT